MEIPNFGVFFTCYIKSKLFKEMEKTAKSPTFYVWHNF